MIPGASGGLTQFYRKDTISYLHDSEHLPAAEFDPLEFLAALSVHIPDKLEQLVHYYGHFSSRARGARKKKSAPTPPPILPLPDPDEQHAASISWAALIKESLGLPHFRAPPKILNGSSTSRHLIFF